MSMSDPAAKEFRLLPGEEHMSAPEEDAGHWVRVYQELIELCELMLTQRTLSLEDSQVQGRLRHYRSRLDHWQMERTRAL